VSGDARETVSSASGYRRAVDPFPLESQDHNKLHAFYQHLAAGRLVTTRCRGCARVAWPPRGFCAACTSDEYEWLELPQEGRVHAFSVQETGVPAGFARPLILAIVDVAGHRIVAPLRGVPDPGALRLGMTVRLAPVRVADDPQGQARHLLAFSPAEASHP
jgi:uncharacterized OB-fold protein